MLLLQVLTSGCQISFSAKFRIRRIRFIIFFISLRCQVNCKSGSGYGATSKREVPGRRALQSQEHGTRGGWYTGMRQLTCAGADIATEKSGRTSASLRLGKQQLNCQQHQVPHESYSRYSRPEQSNSAGDIASRLSSQVICRLPLEIARKEHTGLKDSERYSSTC